MKLRRQWEDLETGLIVDGWIDHSIPGVGWFVFGIGVILGLAVYFLI